MNTTLAVVVSAIVILITALVVITIFSGGINQVGSLTNARSICQTQASSSCRSTNSLPLTWNIPTVSIPNPSGQGGNTLVACGGTAAPNLQMGSDCSGFGGTASNTGGNTVACGGLAYADCTGRYTANCIWVGQNPSIGTGGACQSRS